MTTHSTGNKSVPDPRRQLLRAFLSTLDRGERMRVCLYVVLSLIAALTGAIATVALVPLVQPGHAPTLGGHALALPDGVIAQTAVFVVASIAFALLRWATAQLAARLVAERAVSLRRHVHACLLDAPLPALADASSAEIANVLTYNIEIIVQGFSALLQLLIAAITAAVSLGIAFLVSPALMLALPPLLGLAVLAFRISGHEQARVSRQYVADMTHLFWLSEDFPRRLRHVRSFEREDLEKSGYDAISSRLGQGYRRQQALVASGRLMLELSAVVAIAAIMLLAGLWHGIDRGALITVGLLLGRLLPYLVSTRQSFQQLRSAAPALELWRRHVELGAARATPANTPSAAAAPGALRIHRIGLAPPLADLAIGELLLAPGTMTLICGHSGAGKSSLMDALAGMVEPQVFAAQSGELPLDFATYRAAIRHGAYVGQSVRPWQHSVRDCLAWAEPSADEAAMWRALHGVGLASRLQAGSHGLDTALNSASSKLSGGELQRLLLAQVILKQPQIALLDEATSALDAASERQVLSTLRQRLPHTALVVVSHRTSVSDLADRCLHLVRTPSQAIRTVERVTDEVSNAPRHQFATTRSGGIAAPEGTD